MSEKNKYSNRINIRLDKGMSKEDINKITSEHILFGDCIYMGSDHKHNWICKCGNSINNKAWRVIKKSGCFYCNECKRNIYGFKHKIKIEKNNEFIYIKSYFGGEVLPNGDIVKEKKTYAEYIHSYCGKSNVSRTDYISCDKCCGSYENSLAHHIEVELGLRLEDVWDFEKNTVNPYHISKGSTKTKVWIKCQNNEVNKLNKSKKKDYHGSYEVSCANFVKGARCGYCNPKTKTEPHAYDSFGYYYLDKSQSWSPNNKISPFRVAKSSGKKYKFICPECKNEFIRQISNASKRSTCCGECSTSYGEKGIIAYLKENDIIYQYEKEFDGLVGINNGSLSYDFYIPKYNLLIEYQGEQHRRFIKGFHNSYEDFDRQQEHDKRKREYAKDNNIKLLEIWYYDFDNIESILKDNIVRRNDRYK